MDLSSVQPNIKVINHWFSKVVKVDNHVISCQVSPYSTYEEVDYDGSKVASSHDFFGGHYFFSAEENGEPADYEVYFGFGLLWPKLRVIMTRNENMIYSDYSLKKYHQRHLRAVLLLFVITLYGIFSVAFVGALFQVVQEELTR